MNPRPRLCLLPNLAASGAGAAALTAEGAGYPMHFLTFDGRLKIAVHRPSRNPRATRELLLELEETGDTLVLKSPCTVRFRASSLSGRRWRRPRA